MAVLKYVIGWLLIGIVGAALHLFLRNLLPDLLGQVDFLFAFWAVVLVITKRPEILLASLISIFIVDHYSSLAFGLYTVSFLVGLVAVDRMFQLIFTHRTFYTVFSVVFLSESVVRVLLIFWKVIYFIAHKSSSGITIDSLLAWLFEALCTAVTAMVFFVAYSFFVERVLLQKRISTP